MPSQYTKTYCRPKSVATTLYLIFGFHYLSIIKYQLYSYIIQPVLSGNYILLLASPTALLLLYSLYKKFLKPASINKVFILNLPALIV